MESGSYEYKRGGCSSSEIGWSRAVCRRAIVDFANASTMSHAFAQTR